jgi:hypothetical protein
MTQRTVIGSGHLVSRAVPLFVFLMAFWIGSAIETRRARRCDARGAWADWEWHEIFTLITAR